MVDLIKFFQQSNLFKNIPVSELEKIAQYCSIVSFKKGSRIFSTNDNLDYVYFVKSGTIEIFIETYNNKKEILPSVEKGGIIGEMEVFDNQNIIACCDAKTNLSLIRIKKKDFKEFLTHSTLLLDRIFSEYCSKMEKS